MKTTVKRPLAPDYSIVIYDDEPCGIGFAIYAPRPQLSKSSKKPKAKRASRKGASR